MLWNPRWMCQCAKINYCSLLISDLMFALENDIFPFLYLTFVLKVIWKEKAWLRLRLFRFCFCMDNSSMHISLYWNFKIGFPCNLIFSPLHLICSILINTNWVVRTSLQIFYQTCLSFSFKFGWNRLEVYERGWDMEIGRSKKRKYLRQFFKKRS